MFTGISNRNPLKGPVTSSFYKESRTRYKYVLFYPAEHTPHSGTRMPYLFGHRPKFEVSKFCSVASVNLYQVFVTLENKERNQLYIHIRFDPIICEPDL